MLVINVLIKYYIDYMYITLKTGTKQHEQNISDRFILHSFVSLCVELFFTIKDMSTFEFISSNHRKWIVFAVVHIWQHYVQIPVGTIPSFVPTEGMRFSSQRNSSGN